AARHGVAFAGLWLFAPVNILVDRIEHRTGDASDATPAVVLLQADQLSGEIDWTPLDASRGFDETAAAALRCIAAPTATG
ncbi:MAG: hypothetical protein ABJP53_16720, partial [Bauldia litoralis]